MNCIYENFSSSEIELNNKEIILSILYCVLELDEYFNIHTKKQNLLSNLEKIFRLDTNCNKKIIQEYSYKIINKI